MFGESVQLCLRSVIIVEVILIRTIPVIIRVFLALYQEFFESLIVAHCMILNGRKVPHC